MSRVKRAWAELTTPDPEPPSTWTYGGDKTIHQTEHLDVEVTKSGKVVAVWFRCCPLPFKQKRAQRSRANEMEALYRDDEYAPPRLVSVELAKKLARPACHPADCDPDCPGPEEDAQ